MRDNWETILPHKSGNHTNEWADYIELSCLVKKDIVSFDDVLDVIYDSELIEKECDNEDEYSERMPDRYTGFVEDAFSIIRYRQKRVDKLYPFVLKEKYIEIKEGFDIYNSLYVFLLLTSCTKQVSSFQGYAKRFEEMCGMVIKGISFIGADSYVVGTAGGFKGGSVFDKVVSIGDIIKSGVTRTFMDSYRFKSPSSGDGGVDIMSVRPFNDNYSFRPMILSQCTCSREQWESKQSSISYDIWWRRLNNIPRFIEMMWISFSICDANGMPENPSMIRTCIMDRYRILDAVREDERLIEGVSFSDYIKKEIG